MTEHHDQHDQHADPAARAAEVVAATLAGLDAGPGEVEAAYDALRDACAAYSDAHERAAVLGLTAGHPTPRSLRGVRAVEATTRGRRRAPRRKAA
ncbi:hypothetical protein CSPHI_10390 [Corynebacterium sphenisci DSM 44792]|uniref:Uncharacterized protein n=1 Tax=Corynebacterium sphenisci DSM 44792 TaxID=1437874 RepID=A0A1L7CZQ5_9CORY|nr:hypothetical protein [Corynebacterium sphenisci]APT91338.1 hypothetical protein CSPHI_10390 [Corynebacterium sphenisci DSM 44792]